MRAHENQAAQRAGAQAARGPAPVPGTAGGRLLGLQRLVGNAAVARIAQRERQAHEPGCGHPETEGTGEEAAVQRRTPVGEVLASPGSPLEPRIRSRAEQAYGMSFGHVRVHTGPVAQRSAADFGALAYTTGSHIVSGEPRLDDETLFHEVDHVHQQAVGPVAGTDNGTGARVSSPDDAFERSAAANGRRLARGLAPDLAPPGASGHPASVQRAPVAVHGSAVAVQRKGHDKLKDQLRPQKSTFDSLASWVRKPAPESPVIASVRDALQAYDDSPQRDPERCMAQLATIQMRVYDLMDEAQKAERAYLEEALRVITGELEVLGGQVARDGRMPAAARVPYQDMTDRGPLWKDAEYQDGTTNLGMSGASYVRELSEMNRADQRREIGGRSDDAWVQDVRTKLKNALRQSVVAHYTPKARYDAIAASGEYTLKSKTELDREGVGEKHNTMNVDKHMLANDGFVFFYIEPAGMKGRKSRFAVGKEDEGNDKARIELGLAESGLLSQGWIMLSDLVQRDYPELRTVRGTPGQVADSAKSGEATDTTRTFKRGVPDDDKFMESFSAFKDIDDIESRQSHQLARQYALMDPGSRMVYGPEKHLERPELLHNNILADSDILPGLVDRVVVEIMRFEQSNPALAKSLKTKSGPDLMDFLLRNVVKVQAMIPNSVDIAEAGIDIVEGS
ncbi:eCIS core domain-containing protein [Streptomyces sp. NPDC004031]